MSRRTTLTSNLYHSKYVWFISLVIQIHNFKKIRMVRIYRIRQILLFGKCFKKNYWIFSQSFRLIMENNFIQIGCLGWHCSSLHDRLLHTFVYVYINFTSNVTFPMGSRTRYLATIQRTTVWKLEKEKMKQHGNIVCAGHFWTCLCYIHDMIYTYVYTSV